MLVTEPRRPRWRSRALVFGLLAIGVAALVASLLRSGREGGAQLRTDAPVSASAERYFLPGWLPEGYQFEDWGFDTPNRMMNQTWNGPDGQVVTVTAEVGSGDISYDGDFVRIGSANGTIHSVGLWGRGIRHSVTWAVDGVVFAVTAYGVEVDQLVTIARGLRLDDRWTGELTLSDGLGGFTLTGETKAAPGKPAGEQSVRYGTKRDSHDGDVKVSTHFRSGHSTLLWAKNANARRNDGIQTEMVDVGKIEGVLMTQTQDGVLTREIVWPIADDIDARVFGVGAAVSHQDLLKIADSVHEVDEATWNAATIDKLNEMLGIGPVTSEQEAAAGSVSLADLPDKISIWRLPVIATGDTEGTAWELTAGQAATPRDSAGNPSRKSFPCATVQYSGIHHAIAICNGGVGHGLPFANQLGQVLMLEGPVRFVLLSLPDGTSGVVATADNGSLLDVTTASAVGMHLAVIPVPKGDRLTSLQAVRADGEAAEIVAVDVPGETTGSATLWPGGYGVTVTVPATKPRRTETSRTGFQPSS